MSVFRTKVLVLCRVFSSRGKLASRFEIRVYTYVTHPVETSKYSLFCDSGHKSWIFSVSGSFFEEIPKSINFTHPSFESMMFPGFISRCATFLAVSCKKATAHRTWNIKDLATTTNCSSWDSQVPSGVSEGTECEEKWGEARSCTSDNGRKGM